MKTLFIMDPPERFHAQKDTTVVLVREALDRGIEVFGCLKSDLGWRSGAAMAKAWRVNHWETDGVDTSRLIVERGPSKDLPLSELNWIWMRSDPPVDQDYLTATLLLDHAGSKPRVLNRPQSLRDCNEKLFALSFSHLMPDTQVSADAKILLDAMLSFGGKAVLKPLFGAGGEGVFLLQATDPNRHVIVETATRNGTRPVMVQRYLPEVKAGDKRVILVDGEPLGSVLRISQSDDHRSNIHVGGRTEKTTLTTKESAICSELGPVLREKGLFLVGLDLIGGFLSEINVTSPTGFQEINRLEGRSGKNRVEAQTWDKLLSGKSA